MKPRNWRTYYGYKRAESYSLARKPLDRINPHLDRYRYRETDLLPFEAEYCEWLAARRGCSYEQAVEYAKYAKRGTHNA